MSVYSNNQSQAAGALPVYEVGSAGLNGAIPVYFVAQPANTPPFPNGQGTNVSGVNQGAIPVRVESAPTGTPGNDQGNNANAIPVFVVASGEAVAARYPNQLTNVAGAIPVWRTN